MTQFGFEKQKSMPLNRQLEMKNSAMTARGYSTHRARKYAPDPTWQCFPVMKIALTGAIGLMLGSPTFAQTNDAHAMTIGELPQNLSPWGMFLHADVIVKAVMIGLAIASLVTWTIWLSKSIELFVARRTARNGMYLVGECGTFAQLNGQAGKEDGPLAQLVRTAIVEIRQSAGLGSGGVKKRIALQFERIEAAAARKISRGTGVLATIGATAPFVGLFGTVWGIMDAFIGISRAHTTNLAVVAPGIAEALLATALGLVAAIPAVMLYNVLARSTAHYRALLGDASALVINLVSRDLDRAELPLSQ